MPLCTNRWYQSRPQACTCDDAGFDKRNLRPPPLAASLISDTKLTCSIGYELRARQAEAQPANDTNDHARHGRVATALGAGPPGSVVLRAGLPLFWRIVQIKLRHERACQSAAPGHQMLSLRESDGMHRQISETQGEPFEFFAATMRQRHIALAARPGARLRFKARKA